MSDGTSGMRGLVASRTKLTLAVVAATAGWVGFTFWLASWMREDATSNAAILFVLLGYAFAALAISGGLAVLLGDRLFERGWRERLVGGTPPVHHGDELIAPRSHVLGFSTMVVIGVIALGALSEALSGGALAEYREKGAKRVTLRADDQAAKLEVIAQLGEERREEAVRVSIELLDEVWRSPHEPETIRRAALAALGELVAYLNNAVDQWRAEGKQGRWQELLAVELRTTLSPELLSARGGASGGIRADLGRLLGLMRDQSVERPLLDELVASGPPSALKDAPDSAWVAAVQGLMELRSSSALFAVGLEVSKHPEDEVAPLLALAVSKLVSAYHFARPSLNERTMPDAEREALERVVEAWVELLGSSLPRRCAAAVALQRTRHGLAVEPLIAAFDKAERDAMCATEIIDLGLMRGEALGANLLLRRRLLDAIAVLSEGNPRVKQWVGDRAAAAARGELEAELEPVLSDFLRRLETP